MGSFFGGMIFCIYLLSLLIDFFFLGFVFCVAFFENCWIWELLLELLLLLLLFSYKIWKLVYLAQDWSSSVSVT